VNNLPNQIASALAFVIMPMTVRLVVWAVIVTR
jgi:hypothetical protein